jgi:hypothetical protein
MLNKLLYGSLTVGTAVLLAMPTPGFSQPQQSTPMQQKSHHMHSKGHHHKKQHAHHSHHVHKKQAQSQPQGGSH